MNKLLTLLLLSCLISCIQQEYSSNKSISPSGKYYFITSVNQTNKSKENYGFVVLKLYNSENKFIYQLNTGAGDFNKWAIDWEANSDTIIMNSSDIGIYAWSLVDDKLSEIELTESLKMQAEQIKVKNMSDN